MSILILYVHKLYISIYTFICDYVHVFFAYITSLNFNTSVQRSPAVGAGRSGNLHQEGEAFWSLHQTSQGRHCRRQCSADWVAIPVEVGRCWQRVNGLMGYNDFQHHQCWWISHYDRTSIQVIDDGLFLEVMMIIPVMSMTSRENLEESTGMFLSAKPSNGINGMKPTSSRVRPKRWQGLDLDTFSKASPGAPLFYRRISIEKMGLSENRVYSQWNSHLIGIMISKTIGFRGTLFSDKPKSLEVDEKNLGWLTCRSLMRGSFSRNHPITGPEMLPSGND